MTSIKNRCVDFSQLKHQRLDFAPGERPVLGGVKHQRVDFAPGERPSLTFDGFDSDRRGEGSRGSLDLFNDARPTATR